MQPYGTRVLVVKDFLPHTLQDGLLFKLTPVHPPTTAVTFIERTPCLAVFAVTMQTCLETNLLIHFYCLQIRSSVIKTLPAVEWEVLPVIVKFLMQTVSAEDARQVSRDRERKNLI